MSVDAILVSKNAIKDYEQFQETLTPDEFSDWQISHRDVGGFYSARFNLRTRDKNRALEYLNNGPGRHIEFANNRGIVDWEGMIRSVSFDTGIARIRNDLKNMSNKVFTRYQPVGGGATARGTAAEDTASQDRWGVKVWVLAGGEMSATLADQRAQVFLNNVFWASPQVEAINIGGQVVGEIVLEFICIGYWQVLDWAVYNQTALLGEVNASQVITDLVGDADVSQYILSSEVETNASQVTREYDADRRPTGIIEGITSIGDSENDVWVAGMGLNRSFYYREGAQARLPNA